MPYLAFNLNDGNEFIFDLLEERLSLGRNPGNEIVIDNNQISSFHAEFARLPDGAYLLTDLKSSNGTYVNGNRVESAELKSGDRVRFGQLEARFRDMSIPGPGREKKGPTPSAEEKRRVAESSGGPISRTDFIPLADKPVEADAARVGIANGQPTAPGSQTGAAGHSTPKPLPAPSQKEVAEAERLLKSTTGVLQQVVEQKFAAEIALAALKAAHEQEQRKFDDTRAGNAGVRRQHKEAKLELSRLHDELSAAEKRTAEARARAAETERQFAGWQAGLQKSHALKIQEFDATLAAKQAAIEVADGRLRELEARRVDLETKTAELAETERTLSDLRNEISGDESKRAELASLIATLATERGAHEAEIAKLSTERKRREAGLDEQENALELAVASLTRQCEEKEREIAGLAEQGAAQHTLLQTLSKQTAWLEESVKVRQRRVEAANRYLAGIDSRAAELEARSAAQQVELEDTRARVTKAAAVLEALYNEIQAVVTAKEKLLAEHDEHARLP